MPTTIATLQAVITADSSGFIRSMDSVRGSIAGVEGSTNTLSQTMQRVGATMTAAVTLPLLGIGAAAVHAASDFDASMHNINSIAHMSGEELSTLSQKVLDFGSTTREGPQAVADALYEVYSAGVMGDKAFEIMAVSTKTAEAGLADLTHTTNALTATVMAYSSQNLSAADASNVWTKMVQVGVGSLEDFLANSQKVLPLGNALGISFQDLGANIAYLSQQGGGAKKAMTAVAMAMSNILKPNDTMIEAFGRLGVATGTDLIKKFGSFEGAILALHSAVKDPVEFNKMFSKTGLEAVLTMTNNVDALKKSISDFGIGLDEATQSAWDEQMKSYAAQSDHFNSAMQTLSITIGEQLLPILNPLIDAGTKFLIGLTKTNPEVLKMAVAFGIAAAAVGPLLIILTVIMNPITLLIAAIAALGVAFSTNFMGIRDTVTSVMRDVLSLIQPVTQGIQALWEVLSGTGVSLDVGTSFNNTLDILNQKLNGIRTMPTIAPIQIKIPIKAGMTLSDIYYNSEYSADLQKAMSYDTFVTQAKAQIKGNDPRWLQVGSTLTFGLQVGAKIEPGERGMMQRDRDNLGTKYNLEFLKVKDVIQAQYDYVFKGKPLVDDKGGAVDVAKAMPVLATLRLVVEEVNGIVANWKTTAADVLANISEGISGFVSNFSKNIDWTTMQQIAAKAMLVFSVLWLVFSTVIQALVNLASKIVGSALPVMGTMISDFINTITHVVNGNGTVGQDLLKIAVDMVAGINKFVNDMTGTSGSFQEKFMALSGAISTAIQLVISAIQGAARDIKVAINTFMGGVFEALSSAADALLAAKIITPEQAATIRLTANNIKWDTDSAGLAKGIETFLSGGGTNSPLAGMGNINFDGSSLKLAIQMGNAKSIADQLTIQGREGLKAAIKDAVVKGDPTGMLQVAIPIAVAGGIDVGDMDLSKLPIDIQTQVAKALAATPIDTGTTNTTAAYTDMGKDIIAGLSVGLTEAGPDASLAMSNTATDIQNALTEPFQIHSPSRWSMAQGAFIIAGLVLALAAGTIPLVIASNLMALLGIKVPLTAALSAAAGSQIGAPFMSGLASAISGNNVDLQLAVNGVVGAFSNLKIAVLAIGNDMASQLQVILNRVTGQLNALKTAIQSAGTTTVPTGGGTPTTPHTPGGGNIMAQAVSMTQPELYGSQVAAMAPNYNTNTTNNTSSTQQPQTNMITINGVTDVDKMLFELKRRGINLGK